MSETKTSYDPNLHIPGHWRCAKCNFFLVQSTLSAVDGGITSRDDVGEHCPNDGAPLWRVTWRERATEIAERCELEVAENARLRGIAGAFADIPSHLFWIAGRGRQRPQEPLFAIQLIDPESRAELAIAEGETLDDAIKAALKNLSRQT